MTTAQSWLNGQKRLKMTSNTSCLRSNHETVFRITNDSVGLCCKMHPSPKILSNDLENIRKKLQNGEKPLECNTCWKYENSGVKSWRMTGNDHYKENPNKHQIELYFDNTCDAACVYCSSAYSSRWKQELQNAKFPPPVWATYDDSVQGDNKKSIEHLFNYISEKAKNKKKHDYFEIILLGGEPLLTTINKSTVLDLTIEAFYRYVDVGTELTIIIQTNGNTPKKLMDITLKKIEYFKSVYKGLDFIISLSAESVGKIFEYIRYGCSFNTFTDNLNRWASVGIRINANLAVNSISLCSLKDYLELLSNVSKKHECTIDVSVNAVHSSALSVGILDESFGPYCDDAIDFVIKNNSLFLNSTDMIRKIMDLRTMLGTMLTNDNVLVFENAIKYFENVRKVKLEEINPVLKQYIDEKIRLANE